MWRYLHHFFTGFVLSAAWLGAAIPQWETCYGPSSKTGDFWIGLFLLLLFHAARVAVYVQRSPLRGGMDEKTRLDEELRVWGGLTLPYFSESLLYICAMFALVALGGPEMVTVKFEYAAATVLCFLATFAIILAPVCGSLLGWKLSSSRLPAYMPVAVAGFLTVLSLPLGYEFNRHFSRRTFPLAHVALVVIGALLFLLWCSRSNKRWQIEVSKPHPSLSVACYIPAWIVGMLALASLNTQVVGVLTLVALLSSVPLSFALWLLPIKPCEPWARLVGCFVIGCLASFCMVLLMCFLQPKVPLEDDLYRLYPWYLLGGAVSTGALLCVREVRA